MKSITDPKAGLAFDLADFVANPGKYRLYRTAKIARAIESTPTLAPGQTVAIRYCVTARNELYGGALMPIYSVWAGGLDQSMPPIATLYACALKDFCL